MQHIYMPRRTLGETEQVALMESSQGKVTGPVACRQLPGKGKKVPEGAEGNHEEAEGENIMVTRISTKCIPKRTERFVRTEITEERHSFPLSSAEPSRVKGSFLAHCKSEQSRSSVVALTQVRGRNKWLEQVEEK